MGDLNLNPPPRSSLPPGCRFYPSDEELLRYYLTPRANDDRRFGFDLIKDVDLYRYNPFDLPDIACFRFGQGGRRRHWYCYVAVGDGVRVLRRAGGGYWKRRGRERDVVGVGAQKVVLGTRKRFVFYLGDSKKSAVETDWVMYEYALIDHHEVSVVLCRILVKLSRRKNDSNHVLSSSIRETVMQDDDSVDKKDEALGVKFGLASKIDDQLTSRKVAAAGFELRPCEPVSAVLDNLTARQWRSILEEDYVELDDLSIPEGDFIELDDLSMPEEDYLEFDDLASPLSGFDLT